MKQIQAACDRCGLRAWSRELEQHRIVMRFCDECYWDELEPSDPAKPAAARPAAPAPPFGGKAAVR
jgi:hypothetical protein